MSAAPIRSVAILGGGTAGWMTAAALSKALSAQGVAIALIESDAIGTIGVGEATIPTIHWFNQLIGLDEAAFMAETGATWKLGIEFRGWQGEGSAYFHPFGTYGLPGDAQMLPHRLIRAWNGGHALDIEQFSLTTQMARAGVFARSNGDPRSLLSTLGHAYHFDAGLYAGFLRRMAEERGVRRHEGRVTRIEQDGQTGFIQALTTERGERVAADLFIDCSGLGGLLIEGQMHAGFEDWSHWLPCDSAWAAPTAADAAPPLYTMATAAQAGWRWRIPLQHRVGNGYVFSSKFQDAEAARSDLLAAIGTPTADPRLIRFTPGRRRQAWIGNVVAIGLSSGFLEPLESTSIHLIQTGIGKLLSLFPRQDCEGLLAEQYNRVFAQEMDDVRDFLVLHYHFTQGRSEPMWQACQAAPLPETLAYKVDQFQRSGRLMLRGEELFRDASWFAVMTGQGLRAHDHNPMLDSMSAADNLRHLDALRAAIAKSAAQLQGAR
ncbi:MULTISPECIES: tryptophan halogenase family protein [unclassified Novosphingobium]|uniref:tryptophan halogenase family protein n=1 Tax=unclassified Novosphingobium TaxID=2644732 RepID=UPI00146D48C0|nr:MULTISPECIES: tryptophan halogenase family protein [unclassified Novosphingobium]NMN05176.1 tryptophan halogenase [Novosphingobium sp. SG919]NMN87471.1 tryptophan halogenase [Novosphingobium sp. SG916]